MSERSCFDCQHYSVCAWRTTHNTLSTQFLDNSDRVAEGLAIEKLHATYQLMAASCRHFLAHLKEPDFKENWFKIATRIYGEQVKLLIADGMEEENARHVAFREAVLAAVKSESFLSLARQVPILEDKLNALMAEKS